MTLSDEKKQQKERTEETASESPSSKENSANINSHEKKYSIINENVSTTSAGMGVPQLVSSSSAQQKVLSNETPSETNSAKLMIDEIEEMIRKLHPDLGLENSPEVSLDFFCNLFMFLPV